ncbi:MAG TPA: hypothetical protein VGD65_10400 [Chryseosolibacter sp.]
MDTDFQPQTGIIGENKAVLPVALASFSKLMLQLYQKRSPQIKLKRVDRMNYGNFSTVVRCSSGLILLRDEQSGVAESLPEMRYVSKFVLNEQCLEFLPNVEYTIL